MQLAMIGLGRMGANMVRRLIKGGHQCVVFDMSKIWHGKKRLEHPRLQTWCANSRSRGRCG